MHTEDNINEAAVAAAAAARFADAVTATFLHSVQAERAVKAASAAEAAVFVKRQAEKSRLNEGGGGIATDADGRLFVTPPAGKRRRIEVELESAAGGSAAAGTAAATVAESAAGPGAGDLSLVAPGAGDPLLLDVSVLAGCDELPAAAPTDCGNSPLGNDSGIGLACDLPLPPLPSPEDSFAAGQTSAKEAEEGPSSPAAPGSSGSVRSIALSDTTAPLAVTDDSANASVRSVDTVAAPGAAPALGAAAAAPLLPPLRTAAEVLEAVQGIESNVRRKLVLGAVRSAVAAAASQWGSRIEWAVVTV